MDFFKSSSSNSTSSKKKQSTSGTRKTPSSSSVVVSTIKRRVPAAATSSNGKTASTSQPSRTGTSNALPIEVRARIEAARAAEREREIEREAEAQVIRRKTKPAATSTKKRKSRSGTADGEAGRVTPRDDLFGSDDDDDEERTPRKTPSASSSRSTPQHSAYTYVGRNGVLQPYLVPRPVEAVNTPYDDLVARHGPPVSGASLVEAAMAKSPKQWGAFFKDLPISPQPRCTLQYPAPGASEEFILVVARDRDEYDPISDLLRSVYVIVKHYLTPEQREAFGELDELETSTAAGSIWTGPMQSSRAATPSTPTTATLQLETTPTSVASGSNTPQHTANTLETSSILRSFTKSRNRRSGVLFLHTVERFNAALEELRSTGALQYNIRASIEAQGVVEDIWTRVQDQAYARSVAPRVDELASYRSFSDNVYGELTPRFMSEIAQLCDLKPESTMVDLGCGVGNLVIQTALQVGCKSIGIEAMPTPATLGSLQVSECRRRWAMWDLGAAGGEMSLWQGDFLEDVSIREHMREASVVVVNNYAFTPSLNESLSLFFLDLPNQCKIVSLKPFVPHDFRLTERTAGSPSAILTVQEREYGKGMVSWTERGGKYYIATVDRSQVERFMDASGQGLATPTKRRRGGAA